MTKRDIEGGNSESAEVRMGQEDWGLAKHSTNFPRKTKKFES